MPEHGTFQTVGGRAQTGTVHQDAFGNLIASNGQQVHRINKK